MSSSAANNSAIRAMNEKAETRAAAVAKAQDQASKDILYQQMEQIYGSLAPKAQQGLWKSEGHGSREANTRALVNSLAGKGVADLRDLKVEKVPLQASVKFRVRGDGTILTMPHTGSGGGAAGKGGPMTGPNVAKIKQTQAYKDAFAAAKKQNKMVASGRSVSNKSMSFGTSSGVTASIPTGDFGGKLINTKTGDVVADTGRLPLSHGFRIDTTSAGKGKTHFQLYPADVKGPDGQTQTLFVPGTVNEATGLNKFMQDWGGAIGLASMFLGMPGFAAALGTAGTVAATTVGGLQMANAINNKDLAGAVIAATGMAPGINQIAGLGMSADTLGTIKTVGDTARLGQAIENKDIAGAIQATAGLATGLGASAETVGNIKTAGDVAQLGQAIENKDIAGMLGSQLAPEVVRNAMGELQKSTGMSTDALRSALAGDMGGAATQMIMGKIEGLAKQHGVAGDAMYRMFAPLLQQKIGNELNAGQAPAQTPPPQAQTPPPQAQTPPPQAQTPPPQAQGLAAIAPEGPGTSAPPAQQTMAQRNSSGLEALLAARAQHRAQQRTSQDQMIQARRAQRMAEAANVQRANIFGGAKAFAGGGMTSDEIDAFERDWAAAMGGRYTSTDLLDLQMDQASNDFANLFNTGQYQSGGIDIASLYSNPTWSGYSSADAQKAAMDRRAAESRAVASELPPTNTTGTAASTVLRKVWDTLGSAAKKALTNDKGDVDWARVAAIAGGIYGYRQGKKQDLSGIGYQGGIPKLKAQRTQIDAGLPATGKGRKRLSEVAYTPYNEGGLASLPEARYLDGPTNGQADEIKTSIDGEQPALLSHGEFVIPADIVSALGGGNSKAGAEALYGMMDRVRQQAFGRKQQMSPVDPDKTLPA
jgi:hypothetical protein